MYPPLTVHLLQLRLFLITILTGAMCTLRDATKSFDKVNNCKLFWKLLDTNMYPLMLRLVLYMYTSQSLQVRWGSHTNSRCNVQNGKKQGTVLSPILFSVYIDGLFTRLSNSRIGCHICNHYASGVGFADDIKLLPPSNKGLQMMIYMWRLLKRIWCNI